MYRSAKRPDLLPLTTIALCVALLSISSYLVIPLPFTPIVLSMHTVAVNLIALLLKPKHAACAILVYLLMGLIGLPVFSGGTSGPGKLFGPTGGFYFGFLLAVLLISLFRGKKPSILRYALVTICLGIPVEHLLAILFMGFHNGFDLKAAALAVSLPFIPGDIFKCVLASLAGVALQKGLSKASFPR